MQALTEAKEIWVGYEKVNITPTEIREVHTRPGYNSKDSLWLNYTILWTMQLFPLDATIVIQNKPFIFTDFT